MKLARVPDSEKKDSETDSNSSNDKMIPFEESQRLIDEAAKRASRETLDSLRKLDRESSGDDNLEGDDGGEIDFFATKTNKSIKNMVSSVATLKRAFEQPPSQIESMLYQAFTQNMVQKLTGDGINVKKNWYDEILSSFAHGLGARGPELVDTLTRNFGSDWVKQTAQGLLNPGAVISNNGGYGGQGEQGRIQGQVQEGGVGGVGGKSDLNQDAVDQIMALDPNNPTHVSAYAEIQGNIDINDARKMLMIHQDIFMNKMKRNAAQAGTEIQDVRSKHVENVGTPPVPINQNSQNSDIPPAWAQALIGKIIELENKVNQVYSETGNIRSGNVDPITYVDRGVDKGIENIGKVQTAEEFQMELEEETRREKAKSGNGNVGGNSGGNVNKWEDDPSTDVGMVSHERRLEEVQMRKKPVHDASVELIMKEIDAQKEKLGIVENSDRVNSDQQGSINGELCATTVDEHVEIPKDINSDIEKIEKEDKEDNVDTTKKIELVCIEEVKEQGENSDRANSDQRASAQRSRSSARDVHTSGELYGAARELREATYRKAPKSIIDSVKEITRETEEKKDLSNIMSVKKYVKGSQGWLKEQKELKEKKEK